MKKLLVILLSLCFFTGCSSNKGPVEIQVKDNIVIASGEEVNCRNFFDINDESAFKGCTFYPSQSKIVVDYVENNLLQSKEFTVNVSFEKNILDLDMEKGYIICQYDINSRLMIKGSDGNNKFGDEYYNLTVDSINNEGSYTLSLYGDGTQVKFKPFVTKINDSNHFEADIEIEGEGLVDDVITKEYYDRHITFDYVLYK